MSALNERLSAALADRYRIERELGQGGMATVHLAHDLRHEREVAVKVLRADVAQSLGRERFIREIRSTWERHVSCFAAPSSTTRMATGVTT